MRSWCRWRVLAADGTVTVLGALAGPGPPGLAALDAVARAALDARRRGGRLEVVEAAPELVRWIELAGLEALLAPGV